MNQNVFWKTDDIVLFSDSSTGKLSVDSLTECVTHLTLRVAQEGWWKKFSLKLSLKQQDYAGVAEHFHFIYTTEGIAWI